MRMGKLQAAPFGVGRILEIGGELSVIVQWWGNASGAKASGTFRPGWVRRDNRTYYAHKKEHKDHPEWTNDHTDVPLGLSDIILKGKPEDIFTADDRFNARAREAISNAL